jgi:hypothetical protein
MTRIPLEIEGLEGQDIAVQPASLWTPPQLLVNGQPAPKGVKRGTMLLRRNDGTEVTANWKPTFLGLDVPGLQVDGKPVQITEPLPWYQWVWSALPVILIFTGGALGAIVGMIATAINIKIMRDQSSPLFQYGFTLAVSVGAVIVFVIARAMILSVLAP